MIYRKNALGHLMAFTPSIGGYTILPPRAARRAAASLEFRSMYALTHRLSPREVNIAVRSADYEDYLNDR